MSQHVTERRRSLAQRLQHIRQRHVAPMLEMGQRLEAIGRARMARDEHEIAVGRRKVGPSRPAASDPDCDRDEGSRFDDQEEPAAAASKGQAQQPRSLERDPVHTDGGPVVFKEFVSELMRTQALQVPGRSVPVFAARGLAAVGAIPRFAFWVASQDCILDDTKAREQLGYRPVISREEGLAALRGVAGTPVGAAV